MAEIKTAVVAMATQVAILSLNKVGSGFLTFMILKWTLHSVLGVVGFIFRTVTLIPFRPYPFDPFPICSSPFMKTLLASD